MRSRHCGARKETSPRLTTDGVHVGRCRLFQGRHESRSSLDHPKREVWAGDSFCPSHAEDEPPKTLDASLGPSEGVGQLAVAPTPSFPAARDRLIR